MAKVNAQVQAPVEEQQVKAKPNYQVVEETFDELEFEKSESSNYNDVYFVKPKTKDAAYFEFTKRVGDIITRDPRTTINSIDGNVIKIELDKYTYESRDIKTIKIYINKIIKDRNILFILSSSYTQVARSIINSLLNFNEELKKILIGLYVNPKTGYTSVKVLFNGKKPEWLYSVDEQKKYIETVSNKKGEFIKNDYSDLDELFETKLREHLPILFPNQDHIKFIEEPDTSESAAEFFEIDSGD